jgi:hypothetical protein
VRSSLRTIRIATTDQLLAAGRTRAGRCRLAAACRVELDVIDALLGRADLIGRINGIGSGFVILLELHGITDSARLARQCPVRLHLALRDHNVRHRLLRRSPTLLEINTWIEAARALPPAFEDD